jgi:hypothetical protein
MLRPDYRAPRERIEERDDQDVSPVVRTKCSPPATVFSLAAFPAPRLRFVIAAYLDGADCVASPISGPSSALESITEQNPVPPEAMGKVRLMADAWVTWGERQGMLGNER